MGWKSAGGGHAEAHTAASHSDQGATGAELETLTDGSETALHSHAGAGAGAANIGAEVRLTSNVSTANSTWVAVDWDAEDYDDAGFWAVGNPERITFATAGRYLVVVTAIHDVHTSGSRVIRLLRDGNQAKELQLVTNPGSGTFDTRTQLSCIVDAAANDYVVAEVFQDRGGALDLVGAAGADVETTRLQVTSVAGEEVEDWTTYTLDWKGDTTDPVIGNGVATVKYRRTGTTVTVNISIEMGSTTTYGSGFWYFGLPTGLKVAAGAHFVGSGWAHDAGTGFTSSVCVIATVVGADRIRVIDGANYYSSTVPHGWTDGDDMILQITYETDLS